MRMSFLLVLAFAAIAAGCSNKAVEEAPVVSGETAAAGSALAYEHRVSVSLAPEVLESRMHAVRAACGDARFGACQLLRFEQQFGRYPSGLLDLRAAPGAIEPLVEMAADAGAVGSRSTHAEDLSQAVADGAQELQQLEARRTQLDAFRARKDLAVADMLALAQELAAIETQRAELEKAAAGRNRRIETNLLSIDWRSHEFRSRWATVVEAFADAAGAATDGMAEAIGWLAFGLPFLLVAFPLALLWRGLWRRATRPKRDPEHARER